MAVWAALEILIMSVLALKTDWNALIWKVFADCNAVSRDCILST